jgi:hypothetical protein
VFLLAPLSCWRNSGEAFSEKGVVSSLPSHLRRPLAKHLADSVRVGQSKEIPLLHGLPSMTLTAVVIRLRLVYFNTNSESDGIAYRRQDDGGTLYMIGTGQVSLTNEERKTRRCSAESNPMFGEESFFKDICPLRPETARCSSFLLICHELSAASAAELAEEEPGFYRMLRDLCLLRAVAMGLCCAPEPGQKVRPSAVLCLSVCLSGSLPMPSLW